MIWSPSMSAKSPKTATAGYHLHTGEHRDYRNGRELWPELQTTKAPAAEPAGASEKARELLLGLLKNGPQPAARIIEAGQAAGLSERTIQRAGERLGVAKAKDGHSGWTWALPEQGAKVAA